LALIHFVQSNSFVDHVEAVVLAGGFGHIGVPYPATVTLVTGGGSGPGNKLFLQWLGSKLKYWIIALPKR
jgi:hypothetical protein